MKLVVDTNVVVSGLLWLGNPGRVLEAAAAGVLTIYTSVALIDELADTLGKPKLAPRVLASGFTLDELLQRYLDVAIAVVAPPIDPVVLADPDDDHVLACALAAQAASSFPATRTCSISGRSGAFPSSAPQKRSRASGEADAFRARWRWRFGAAGEATM